MSLFLALLLFFITVVGGCIPLWLKSYAHKHVNYLLAFSGSFLLSITFLHLLPESFTNSSHAGIYILAGFFIQLVIQRITHGVEHGHVHIHTHHHHIPLVPIIAGLALHAFMEGLPLGISNTLPSTQRPLYLAVAAHKLPEAMVVATIALSAKGRRFAYITLILFAAITPIASIFAGLWQKYYEPTTAIGGVLIPIVAGAFIQIATTIFFESGTLQHQLTTKKIASILLGVILALGMVWW